MIIELSNPNFENTTNISLREIVNKRKKLSHGSQRKGRLVQKVPTKGKKYHSLKAYFWGRAKLFVSPLATNSPHLALFQHKQKCRDLQYLSVRTTILLPPLPDFCSGAVGRNLESTNVCDDNFHRLRCSSLRSAFIKRARPRTCC
ncbi:hypothetical protein HAX54_017766 [Datura stramonium]|uniref:Uncharacterized protein n=1 Tax=Datura stramonium TaxID=4076 RepID=A0ABS8UME6_DATST|nr:hypothetical protein [Datura stramonium]